MDPYYSAQDVARCDLCEIAIAQSYCDFCHVNLCKPCIGEHISDDYSRHTIVPFHQRRSTLIYPKCKTHPKKSCELQCTDCNVFLCTICLASEQHNKEHKLSNLEEVFNKKKDHIKMDKEKINKQLWPAYEDIKTELENQIEKINVDYKKLTTQMAKHREELHKEIDNAMNLQEKEIDENKTKHHAILKKQLEEIKQLQSLMQERLHTLNEMEDSNEVSPTIQYSSRNHEFSNLPPKVNVSIPKFIKKQIEKGELCRLIGKVTPLSTTLEERVFTAKKLNTSARELLDEAEVLNTIKTGHERLNISTCFNEEEIWTSGETADIKCFNTQGVLQKTIKTKSGDSPIDIAVYSDGALVYSDGSTGTLYKVKNDQTEEIIRLQGWTPTNLCATSSGDLLVTMLSNDFTKSKIVRYSGSTVKQTIQFDDEGQPLYSGNINNKYITENRNLDICMADWEARAVVVVNQAGKLRFRYTGQFSSTKKEPLDLYGITTDSQSRILTSDWNNHSIHILDEDGRFLQYIDHCDLNFPVGLCVDKCDNLFVCEYEKGNVRKIKYSK
uniref:Uncharacterized protein LOC111101798 n=1 Tax=Crassostrea virginica TaxID=6565 RepID=A0A8B8AFE5_CRAVI|nr:uncharacterized protein LOC111101798 [Crassostrea virginica]